MSILMQRIYWAFGRETYATYEDFVTAATAYNATIDPEGPGWRPDQVVSTTSIEVVYEALWKDEDNTLQALQEFAGCNHTIPILNPVTTQKRSVIPPIDR